MSLMETVPTPSEEAVRRILAILLDGLDARRSQSANSGPSEDDAAQDPPRLLYALPEAARQLSVSLKKLEELVRDGEVMSVKIGRRRLVAREDLEEYVNRLRGMAPARPVRRGQTARQRRRAQ